MPALRGVFAASASLLTALAALSATASPGLAVTPSPWPASPGLVLAEVVTGGVSASDEYIEIYNAGSLAADAGGLQVLYVSASGATVTCKLAFPAPFPVGVGQHALVANAAGAYAPLADATYTGGLAADGGSVVLETPGGIVVDAVSWGSATNAYAEGSPAPAPPARSSIERLPGGSAGNGQDTNANRTDWAIQSSPIPQPLSAPPVPAPSASPTARATETPAQTAANTPSPTDGPIASPTDGPVASPTNGASSTASPTDGPSQIPVATVPPTIVATTTPTATPLPTETAGATEAPTWLPTIAPSPTDAATPPTQNTPTPIPTESAPTSIAQARASADGATVSVEGVVTASLGSLESGRGGFVQDSTGGVAVYLSAVPSQSVAAGTLVRVTGTVGDRYGQRTVRVDVTAVEFLGTAPVPEPPIRATGAVGESDEGAIVAAMGTVTASPDQLADGMGLWLDDGSGPVRVVATPTSLGVIVPVKGMQLQVAGPVGQHSSGSSPGYRLEATEPGQVVVIVTPGPSPSPSPRSFGPSIEPSAGPTRSAAASSTPSGTPRASASAGRQSPTPPVSRSPSPSPSASPSPTSPVANPISIATARSLPIGTRVRVAGAVTAGPGALGSDGLVSIEDSSAGIFLRLAAPIAGFVPGRSVEVVGVLAAPYGQLEVREVQWIAIGDLGEVPAPAQADLGAVGEAFEGSLIRVRGTVDSVAVDAGRLTVVLSDGTSQLRLLADPAAGLSRADVTRGSVVVATGIVGQRASAVGRLDGYRLWLRDRLDLSVEGGPSPTPGGSAGPIASSTPGGSAGPVPTSTPRSSGGPSLSPTAGASAGSSATPRSSLTHAPTAPATARATAAPYRDLASAIHTRGARVDLDATVTAPAGLLDIDGPTIVVDDGTAAVAVVLPDGSLQPRAGSRVHVVGTVGTWHTGPKVTASGVQQVANVATVLPKLVTAPPGPDLEWRLVQVCGRIDKLTRVGARWRAELLVDGRRVVVLGEPASGVPAAWLGIGRLAVVTGIVRRSTSDNSAFQILPRTQLDVRVAPPAAGATAVNAPQSVGPGEAATSALIATTPHANIGDLAESVGRVVVVSGLVTEADGRTATLDDGTGSVVLGGSAAAESLAILEPGDALEVTGEVQSGSQGLTLIVDPDGIVSLGGVSPGADPAAQPSAPAGGAGQLGIGAGTSNGSVAADPGDSERKGGSIGNAAGLHLGTAEWGEPSPLWLVLAVVGLAGALLLVVSRPLLAARRRSRRQTIPATVAQGAAKTLVPYLAAAAIHRLRAAGPRFLRRSNQPDPTGLDGDGTGSGAGPELPE